jgi:hypothetical protein
MSVRILLDHGVKEENIIICCILISKVGGVWALKRAFPKVKIACSAADPGLEERIETTQDGKKKKVSCFPNPTLARLAIDLTLDHPVTDLHHLTWTRLLR